MSLSTRKKSKISRKKIIILIAIAAIIVGVIVAAWFFFNDQQKSQQQTINPVNTTNLDPPTAEEQQEAEQNKSEVTKDQQKEASNTTPVKPGEKIDAKPFIVFVGQEGNSIELNGYTSAVFEDGGSCIATFTKGTLKVTRSVTGFADARHTTCPPISIPRGDFAQPGDWTAKLTYDSQTAAGTSTEATVTIK